MSSDEISQPYQSVLEFPNLSLPQSHRHDLHSPHGSTHSRVEIVVTDEQEVKSLLEAHFHDHIQRHTTDAFSNLVDSSGHIWNTLPDSVIGTLIYFLLIEHNLSTFDVIETLKNLFCVGFPVYFTFFLQINILYELYLFLDHTDAHLSYCSSSFTLLVSIISVFYIFMMPSFKSILNETYIILKGERVAFTTQAEDETVIIHRIFAPLSKRIFMFLVIVVPESTILLFCTYTGVAYV